MSDQPNERPGLDEWLRRTLQSLPPLSAEQVSTISRVVTEIDRARARRAAQSQRSSDSGPARTTDGEVVTATADPTTDEAASESARADASDPPAEPSGWIRDEIDAELAMLRVARADGDQRQITWHRGVLDGLVRAAAGAGVATRAALAGYVAERLLDQTAPATSGPGGSTTDGDTDGDPEPTSD